MTLLIEAFLALIIYIALSEILNPTPKPPVPPAQVSATLLAVPNAIHPGESSLLTWTSKNAISAKLDTVVVPLQGSRTVSPTATTTYTLVVDGPGGPLAEVEVISVTPAPPPPPPPPPSTQPAIQVSASSTQINEGMSVILTWSSQNADSVSIDALPVALSGSRSIKPLATTTLTFVAVKGDLKASASVTITVTPTTPVPSPNPGVTPTVTISASPEVINAGDSTTVTWSTTNATSLTFDGLSVAMSGSSVIKPIATHTYILVAKNGDLQASAGVTITVVPIIVGNKIHLSLFNQSSVQIDIPAYLAAQNLQLSGEFKREWNIDAYIDTIPGGWPVYLMDISDVAGALGYHDYDVSPYARVFIKTSANDNIKWQTVASHEVLEMLVDPGPSWLTVKDQFGNSWDKEVGDPVEDVEYSINGVPLTDYADPSWFVSLSSGKWDTRNILVKDHGMTAGGYAIENGNPVYGPSLRTKYGSGIGVDGSYKRKQGPAAQPR